MRNILGTEFYPDTSEEEIEIKIVPLTADMFDQLEEAARNTHRVIVHAENNDLKGTPLYRGPTYGVVITKPDGQEVAYYIEPHQAVVSEGDLVQFFREKPRT